MYRYIEFYELEGKSGKMQLLQTWVNNYGTEIPRKDDYIILHFPKQEGKCYRVLYRIIGSKDYDTIYMVVKPSEGFAFPENNR